MSNCCNGCAHTDPVVKKQMDELAKGLAKNNVKDFQQDGFITQLFNLYRCEIVRAVADYMEVLKASGELDELLAHMAETLAPYFSGLKTEKYTKFGTDYYVTVVPCCDAEGKKIAWKLGVANDAYDGIGVESTIEFAHRKNATLAINCGVFNMDTDSPIGVLIKDGRIVQTGVPAEDKYQYLAIMQNGSFRVYPRTTTAGQMLNDGATDAVCIFGTLLQNGVMVNQTDDRDDVRQSIGVRSDGSIVIVTVDGRNPGEDAGATYAELAQIQAENGSVNAWILDGGGSASTVLRGVKQNDNVDYWYIDRAVNTFLYIEKYNTADPSTNPSNDIGIAKQQLIEMLNEKKDFLHGFIRIRGQENYWAPGIEFYTNNEETRRAKFGMTIDKNNARNSYMYINFRPENAEKNNLFRIYDQGVFMQTYHGISADRPNAPIGTMFFDEGFGKPIWKSADGWIDANGNPI